MIGNRYGRLVVIGESPIRINRRKCYVLLCDCGKLFYNRSSTLFNGNTQSCGCLHKERVRKPDSNHPLRPTFDSIKQRCYNPNNISYKYYGARGVTMCEEWKNNFKQFVADMGPRPDGCSIDRLDNDKGYEPGNCEWRTAKEQANNRRMRERNLR